MTQTSPEKPRRGGFLSNLAFNIVIPVIILSKFSGAEDLGPAWSIVVALSFPITYGLWDLKQSGKVNAFSILGIVSVFLTGGMSLLELDPKYIAIKEAAVPAIIGIAVLITQKTRYPIVKVLILNEQIIKIDKLYDRLSHNNAVEKFERILTNSSYIVAGSFALSSVLNYVLAKVILISPPGTTEFSEELGKMTALSYPVIALPSMVVMLIAIWYLFSRIGKLTGESIENFIVGAEAEPE
jgi:intracellular septation protein A